MTAHSDSVGVWTHLACDADPDHPCPSFIDGGPDGTETSLRHTAHLLGWGLIDGKDLCPAHRRTVESWLATKNDPERMAWLREQIKKADERRRADP